MQETRPEFETGGDPFVIADAVTDLLQYPLVRFAHLNVGQQRKIVAVVEPVEMRLKIAASVSVPLAVSLVQLLLLVREELDPLPCEMGASAGSAPLFS